MQKRTKASKNFANKVFGHERSVAPRFFQGLEIVFALLDASKSSANAKPVEFAVPGSFHNQDNRQDRPCMVRCVFKSRFDLQECWCSASAEMSIHGIQVYFAIH